MTIMRGLILMTCWLVAATRPTHADLVMAGSFTGEVIFIDATWAPPPVSLFETFNATFSYDPHATDTSPGDPAEGRYLGALKSLTLAFDGGFVVPISLPVDGHVIVEKDTGNLRLIYPFGQRAPTSDPRFAVDAIDASLSLGSQLAGDSLPSAVGNNVASTGAIYTYFSDPTQSSNTIFDFWIQVTPNSLSVAAVPEPSAGLLLGAVASVMLVTRGVRWVRRRVGSGNDESCSRRRAAVPGWGD